LRRLSSQLAFARKHFAFSSVAQPISSAAKDQHLFLAFIQLSPGSLGSIEPAEIALHSRFFAFYHPHECFILPAILALDLESQYFKWRMRSNFSSTAPLPQKATPRPSRLRSSAPPFSYSTTLAKTSPLKPNVVTLCDPEQP
jgi:hypothetical protein